MQFSKSQQKVQNFISVTESHELPTEGSFNAQATSECGASLTSLSAMEGEAAAESADPSSTVIAELGSKSIRHCYCLVDFEFCESAVAHESVSFQWGRSGRVLPRSLTTPLPDRQNDAERQKKASSTFYLQFLPNDWYPKLLIFFKLVVARRAVYHTLNVITISLYVRPSVCVKWV